ncbi:J domain-containing protein [uncultured Sphingomonas sp.]|uniref:J domain-containing protein n=1 Tax=uncultured Sphingomonas sp. TaxID=158754 RepID=UPI0035CC6E8B
MKLLVVVLLAWLAWRWLRPTRAPADRALIDARAVLGVGLHADADAIRAAHRRLVAEAHPDRGGSPELARRLNTARDLLLRHGGRP